MTAGRMEKFVVEHRLGAAVKVATRVPRTQNMHSILPRPRVVELIETASCAALCIVRAPYRSGKSVAVWQWACTTDKELLWLHLTQQDSTQEKFWAQLRSAFAVRIGSLPGCSSELEFSQDPVAHLIGMLQGAAPFTLVLEDYHWVPDALVELGLRQLLKSATGLSIVLVARSTLKIEELQITGYVDLQVVTPEQLDFSPEEAAQFHAGTVLAEISTELNRRLMGKAALHRAAARAALEPRQRAMEITDDIMGKVGAAIHREIDATLAQWLDPEVGSYLAATLHLVHFDLELAKIAAPGTDAAKVTLLLEEIGFLWATTSMGATVYGYQEAYKESLRVLVAAESEACRSSTLTAATQWELARKAYLPAFIYAVGNGELGLASSVLVKSGLRLLFEPTPDFADALKRIPNTQIVKYPLLSLGLGLVYNADKRTRFKGLEYFALALTSSNQLGKSLPPEDKMAVNLAQSVALRLTGQFKLAATTARNGIKSRAELPLADTDRLEIFESITLEHWGLALLFVGDFPGATKALHNAVSTGQKVDSAHEVFFATSLLAYRYALDGDLRMAEEYASAAREILPGQDAIELYQQTPLMMASAMVELGRRNPEAAAGHLNKVIPEITTSEFWGQLRTIEAQIDLLRGRPGVALGRLELALAKKPELPAQNPIDAAALTEVQVELMLAAGNASGAAAILGKSKTRNSATVVARARLGLSMGRPQDVVEMLSGTIRYSSEQQGLEALVLLTAARLQLQPAAILSMDIQRIIGAVEELGNEWPLVLLPASDLNRMAVAAADLGLPTANLSGTPAPIIPGSLSMIALTPREASILATLATTGDRAEIARIHFVSVNTIKTQLRTLYKKLGVNSREDALLVAHQEHLLKR